MPSRILHSTKTVSTTFEAAFDQVRDELDVPSGFDYEVLAEAAASELDGPDSGSPGAVRVDAKHLPLVAVDPPGATDLDQAFWAERVGDGYRVHYAIADVAGFVRPGGLVDIEARNRGTTLYSPDSRCPLHPRIISEDRASLLPGGDKPALLWTIDLDGDGKATDWRLERAMVHVREAISYAEAQRRIDQPDRIDAATVGDPGVVDGAGDTALSLLATIGRLRQGQEAARGGVSLSLPPQEVVEADGTYRLEFGSSLPVEGWNAQISLLSGMVAGHTMVDAGVGILRTLPPPDGEEVVRLRGTASALGLDWPESMSYAAFVRDLRADGPRTSAFLLQCTRVFRGAGYLALEPGSDENGSASGSGSDDRDLRRLSHGAIASVYAHVTAPLRRLVDRFGNEILLAVFADREPPAWAVEALEELPSHMGRARQRESALERAMVDMTEAIVLAPHVGQTFDGLVVDVAPKRGRATVQIDDPAVVAHIGADGRRLAEPVRLRLQHADPTERRIDFQIVDS